MAPATAVGWRADYDLMFSAADHREEVDYEITDIVGVLPAELRGTWWRNGMGFSELGGRRIHPVDADGMVCRVSFAGGRAFFSNRYVRTKTHVAEKEAGRVLIPGGYGTRPEGMPPGPPRGALREPAQTSVLLLPRQGRLLAMTESHPPYEMDPASLRTHGTTDLGGAIPAGANFSAHPRVDVARQRLLNFGVTFGPRSTLRAWEIDLRGAAPRLVQQHRLPLGGAALVHDCAITDNWLIVMKAPLRVDLKRMMRGEGLDAWLTPDRSPAAAAAVHLLPRDPARHGARPGAENTQAWSYAVPGSWFSYHHVNAFERGDGAVCVDSVVYRSKPPLDMSDTAGLLEGAVDAPERGYGPGVLSRFVLPPPGAAGAQGRAPPPAPIAGAPPSMDMPALLPGLDGRPYRYVYGVDTKAEAGGEGRAPWAGLVKVDVAAGAHTAWRPPRAFCSAPAVAPMPAPGRGGGDSDAAWVLSLGFEPAARRSVLYVIDARRFADGPVAELRLRRPVPFSFHCCFTPEYYGPPAPRM